MKRLNVVFSLCLAVVSTVFAIDDPSGGALAGERYRVLVSTDIGGSDKDDMQSIAHFFLYADLFDIEGLVSSPPQDGRVSHIKEAIDAYEKDYPKLSTHSSNYPSPDYLRSITKQGKEEAGMKQTDGSDWIVQQAHKSDSRPLWVLVWGAISDVAQAVKQDPSIKSSIRVHFIGSWNKGVDTVSFNYLDNNHKDLWIIEDNGTFRGWYENWDLGGDLANKAFVEQHVKGHGALGDYFYPLRNSEIKMGDTPTYAYLLRGSDDDPTTDHWGGRYRKLDGRPNWYTDLQHNAKETVSQYRENYLRDWQHRMDRCIEEGNEQPPPEDDTPPSAPSNLNASAVGKSQIDLSWDAASDGESGVDSYKIYSNGEEIGTSTNTSYSDEGLNEGTGYTYRVSAVNGKGMEGEKSGEASATTGSDQDPPRLASVAAQSETSVKVVFNEPVTQASAEETSHYQISGGITVSGASLESDRTSVILTTSALTLGTTYTLTVSNISDKASTPNTGGDQKDFSFSGELEITNLTVASGKTYEIVENIAEGDMRYIDRTFGLESVDDLAGMHYIRTANDDKGETGDNFLSFDVSRPVTVYVAYRHGTDLPSWLSTWTKTGDEVCGDGCSDVYTNDFDAGTVTLGGNMPGGAGNMYVVFVAPQGAATASFAAPDLSTDAVPRVRVLSGGALLRVSGLYPQTEYILTLTDVRGRVSSAKRTAGARGAVALSTVHHSGGVYVIDVRSRHHRCSAIAVVP